MLHIVPFLFNDLFIFLWPCDTLTMISQMRLSNHWLTEISIIIRIHHGIVYLVTLYKGERGLTTLVSMLLIFGCNFDSTKKIYLIYKSNTNFSADSENHNHLC